VSTCAYPCQTCGMSPNNSVHERRTQYGYHAYKQPPEERAEETFIVEPHSRADKQIVIYGPLTLFVDYDDVNHDEVDEQMRRLVQILNDNWRTV